MGELIFFGLIVLAIPLVPFVLSIRAYMRIGRMERSIEDLERRVDRLYAAAVAGQQRELREARETRLQHDPETPVEREAAVVTEASRAAQEIPQPILAATPAPHSLRLDLEASSFRLQTAGTSHDAESLEQTIGTRWLLYVGIVAIVIGAAYFEKLAIERGWIGETARVLQGGVVGLAL
ncbi:MAG TPA: hypothetical protein VN716_26510, partial [Vicinamibacterales bacterium]|nr:hypothetical protein [Vicinamibacterales bacterium]